MAGQGISEPVDEIGLQQVVGADVHTHRDVQPHRHPAFDLLERRLDHPFAELAFEIAAVQVRQEFAGRQQAALRMLPTRQRFGADHLATHQVDLGLVEQNEFISQHPQSQAIQMSPVALGHAIALRVEKLIAVLAGQLCPIHRLIGVAEQGIGIGVIRRVQADPDAGRNRQAVSLYIDRLAHRQQQAVQNLRTFLRRGDIAEKDDKFVAPQTGQGVVYPQHLFQVFADTQQQLISDCMAISVIDHLETVDIHETDRRQLAASRGAGKQLPEAIG
ncbi:hypothetical protein SDC9_143784 [bioreactor metagenome]|uniref:Uncharacterized protein n=1 Tax=bioreactor metagenome TaxID=1076179 RepID=A0A645E502_9ZZZZ